MHVFLHSAAVCNHFQVKLRWRWTVIVMPMMTWCQHQHQAVLMTCLVVLTLMPVWWMTDYLFSTHWYFTVKLYITLKTLLKRIWINVQRTTKVGKNWMHINNSLDNRTFLFSPIITFYNSGQLWLCLVVRNYSWSAKRKWAAYFHVALHKG